jgi:hypothetical protein
VRATLVVLISTLPFAAKTILSAQTDAPQFNASDATSVLDAINSRPVPPNAFRVLFIGDSLTLHQPVTGLWDHFMGMAATAPANDFVHLAAAHMQLRMQGGENDPFDDTFQATYRSLLRIFNPPQTRVIVLGDWNSKQKSQFEEAEAKLLGIPFVSLTEIHANPVNFGDGGPYHVGGVAAHPNDKGMQAIADAIESNFDRLASR